jgi:Tol biopolymer transport system component
MGEVYRARDTRLQRDVAVKVLPAAFAADPERLERFEQEARAAAALNHPNILAVFDFGQHDSAPFIVSELLEGQTLRAIVADGPVSPRRSADIARQIATGLAAAHDQGVVHRDLKPENVFVTADGRVKILDFGLAKLTQADPALSAMTTLPTTPPAGIAEQVKTIPGMVMGTVGYMAPEQVRGLATDSRSDIFALGVVLYEMLAGRRAFSGETSADVTSAILRADPPEFDASMTVPPALARVVARCLEKQAASRFQSASDLAFALQTAGADTRTSSGAVAIPAAPNARRGSRVAVAAVAVTAVAILAWLGLWRWRPASPAAPLLRVELALPANVLLGNNLALSPDGRRVVFTARQSTTRVLGEETGTLWLRTLDTGDTRSLPNTDRARTPFWSPDGSAIGFFSDGALRVIDVSSGKVRVLCQAAGARTWGTWNNTGTIVFATESGQPLMRIDAAGGSKPVAATVVPGLRPTFLPDGTHFVFGTMRELAAGELGRTDITSLHETGSEPHFADGYLLFVRNGDLVAQPFDATTLRLSGTAISLAELNGYQDNGVGTNFAIAGDVLLFTNIPRDERRLAWRARDGSALSVVEGEGSWLNPDLSPDGTRLVASRATNDGTALNVWIVDVARGGLRQLVGTPANEQVPFWSPDGHHVIYSRQGGGGEESGTFEKGVDENSERQLGSDAGNTSALTSDGRTIVGFRVQAGNRDILVGPVDGSKPPTPFAQGPGNETQPALSPDNRWLAYTSDEIGPSGRRDIFIQAFPAGGQKVQVSGPNGGVQPRWRRDGRELLFVDDEGWITSAPVVSSGETLRLGPLARLFKTDIPFQPGLGTRAYYDVTNDGSRFVIAESRQTTTTGSIELIVNWKQLLAAKAATQ